MYTPVDTSECRCAIAIIFDRRGKYGFLQMLHKESLPAWDTAKAASLPAQPDESSHLHIPVPTRSDAGAFLMTLKKETNRLMHALFLDGIQFGKPPVFLLDLILGSTVASVAKTHKSCSRHPL